MPPAWRYRWLYKLQVRLYLSFLFALVALVIASFVLLGELGAEVELLEFPSETPYGVDPRSLLRCLLAVHEKAHFIPNRVGVLLCDLLLPLIHLPQPMVAGLLPLGAFVRPAWHYALLSVTVT